MRKTLNTVLPAVLAGLVAAACGGPASELRDVVDEARDRVERLLDAYNRAGDPEERTSEALAALRRCPPEYEQPPLHTSGPPPFEGEVDRPASLPAPEAEEEALYEHQENCVMGENRVRQVPRRMERTRTALEAYSDYADILDRAIGALSPELAEEISIQVNTAPSDDDEDPFGARYRAFIRGMQLAAAETRSTIMAGVFTRTGANPESIPTDAAALEELAEPWPTMLAERARAVDFFTVRNDFQRRLYEGPDAEDPDVAAPGWDPPTGRWTGRYRDIGALSRDGEWDVAITIRTDGGTSIAYPDVGARQSCSGELVDAEPSGTAGRTVTYREQITDGPCGTDASVVLERTGLNRMRYRWSSGQYYGGELTRSPGTD